MSLNAQKFATVSFDQAPEFLPLKPGKTRATVLSLTEKNGYKGEAHHALVRVDETTQPGVVVGETYTLRFTPNCSDNKRGLMEFKKLGLFVRAVMEITEKEVQPAKMIEMVNSLCSKGDISSLSLQIDIHATESSKTNDKGQAFVNFRFEAV